MSAFEIDFSVHKSRGPTLQISMAHPSGEHRVTGGVALGGLGPRVGRPGSRACPPAGLGHPRLPPREQMSGWPLVGWRRRAQEEAASARGALWPHGAGPHSCTPPVLPTLGGSFLASASVSSSMKGAAPSPSQHPTPARVSPGRAPGDSGPAANLGGDPRGSPADTGRRGREQAHKWGVVVGDGLQSV